MPGDAKIGDRDALNVGASCIIEVNEVNSPTGLWWGKVVAVEVIGHDHAFLLVDAVIDGGRFAFEEIRHTPIRSDELKGQQPSVNYSVYPDTETTRELLRRLQYSRQLIVEEHARTGYWQMIFHETITCLGKARAVAASHAEEGI